MNKQRVYLDNAATTPIAPEVIDAMLPWMTEHFGNPSSTHAHGRKVRGAIESARKQIAERLKVTPGEIFFTSGGTEADNMALKCSVNDLGVKTIITSPIEHHAVLHTVENLEKTGKVNLLFVKIKPNGHVDLQHLEELLASNTNTLVSLMHANNEIGNLLPIDIVSSLCKKYNALFHSDTVQSVGHYDLDLSKLSVDFIVCSAHKFNGPKGIGFIYINKNLKLHPLITGGAQERNMRGGTENIYGIIGLAKAFEITVSQLQEKRDYISNLKMYAIKKLKDEIQNITFNGDYDGECLFTVLNMSLPPSDLGDMLLFNLDLKGVSVSGGSACSSGSNKGSHVIRALGGDLSRIPVRISFSHYNTISEIDYAVSIIKECLEVKVTV